MESFYRVNVSLNGTFYFRIDQTNTSRNSITEMVRDIRKRFPAKQGFLVGLTYWGISGQPLEVE